MSLTTTASGGRLPLDLGEPGPHQRMGDPLEGEPGGRVGEHHRRQRRPVERAVRGRSFRRRRRSAMAARPGVPGATTSRASWSESTTTAPRSRSAALTVDLPDPIPPVTATVIIISPSPASRSTGARRVRHAPAVTGPGTAWHVASWTTTARCASPTRNARAATSRTEGAAVSIVMTRTRPTGRHRLGRPGLIPVTALVTVVRRGFFAALFRSGRHRGPVAPRRAAARPPGRSRRGLTAAARRPPRRRRRQLLRIRANAASASCGRPVARVAGSIGCATSRSPWSSCRRASRSARRRGPRPGRRVAADRAPG